jgi:hypoxanthine phosphoribosyltransferase
MTMTITTNEIFIPIVYHNDNEEYSELHTIGAFTTKEKAISKAIVFLVENEYIDYSYNKDEMCKYTIYHNKKFLTQEQMITNIIDEIIDNINNHNMFIQNTDEYEKIFEKYDDDYLKGWHFKIERHLIDE